MKRIYIVNNQKFETQKALLQRIRDIRDAYELNTPLNKQDTKFLFSLIRNYHQSSDIKIGSGVQQIEVRQNKIYKKNREFWIVRVDGTETDFSFMECLRPSKQVDKFKTACRNAVSKVVKDFKLKFWSQHETAICPLTGEVMSFDNSHVHHLPPIFEDIVNDFIVYLQSNLGIEHLENISLSGKQDGVIGDKFEDSELEKTFVDFHNKRANLQVVSAFGNLSVAKRSKEHGTQLSLFD